jgi:hypothetical protein
MLAETTAPAADDNADLSTPSPVQAQPAETFETLVNRAKVLIVEMNHRGDEYSAAENATFAMKGEGAIPDEMEAARAHEEAANKAWMTSQEDAAEAVVAMQSVRVATFAEAVEKARVAASYRSATVEFADGEVSFAGPKFGEDEERVIIERFALDMLHLRRAEAELSTGWINQRRACEAALSAYNAAQNRIKDLVRPSQKQYAEVDAAYAAFSPFYTATRDYPVTTAAELAEKLAIIDEEKFGDDDERYAVIVADVARIAAGKSARITAPRFCPSAQARRELHDLITEHNRLEDLEVLETNRFNNSVYTEMTRIWTVKDRTQEDASWLRATTLEGSLLHVELASAEADLLYNQEFDRQEFDMGFRRIERHLYSAAQVIRSLLGETEESHYLHPRCDKVANADTPAKLWLLQWRDIGGDFIRTADQLMISAPVGGWRDYRRVALCRQIDTDPEFKAAVIAEIEAEMAS